MGKATVRVTTIPTGGYRCRIHVSPLGWHIISRRQWASVRTSTTARPRQDLFSPWCRRFSKQHWNIFALCMLSTIETFTTARQGAFRHLPKVDEKYSLFPPSQPRYKRSRLFSWPIGKGRGRRGMDGLKVEGSHSVLRRPSQADLTKNTLVGRWSPLGRQPESSELSQWGEQAEHP